MSRQSTNEVKDGRLINGYDYDNQCWVIDGIVQACAHPEAMNCGCYGREHAGEESQVQS